MATYQHLLGLSQHCPRFHDSWSQVSDPGVSFGNPKVFPSKICSSLSQGQDQSEHRHSATWATAFVQAAVCQPTNGSPCDRTFDQSFVGLAGADPMFRARFFNQKPLYLKPT